MPSVKREKITTAPGSDQRQGQIQQNHLTRDVMRIALANSTDTVWSWQSAAANSGQALGRGSTDTAVATGKLTAGFGGIPETKAAVTTGLAPTAQTVPANTWAVYAIDMVTGGTLSVAPGAANATTGYSTEALAIAAQPARITAKARLGYYTVKTAVGLAWIGATDGLAGGSSGNVASATNYYPYDGLYAPTGQAYGPNGIVSAAANALPASVSSWVGGRNGVIVASVLAIGSTDTRFSSTAFIYSANGVTNINKAADTTGTALGALGTIPADKWGILVNLIDSVGTKSTLSGPANYVQGYATEAAAIADLAKIYPTATASGGLCMYGYLTVKTMSGQPWIAGTDAFAGGTTGNEASATNYYPTAGITFTSTVQGEVASVIASQTGQVILDAQY